MNEKITAHPQKEEREKVLKEIRQLENRKKILENKQRNEERRGRTRRLIERGAVLEGIFPLAPDLSGAEVKAFLITLSHLPGAVELTANLPNPLCALRSRTPALRLFGSTEPVIPSLKGGVPHRFLSYPRQYYQTQRGPFCRCRSCLPQRNKADK